MAALHQSPMQTLQVNYRAIASSLLEWLTFGGPAAVAHADTSAMIDEVDLSLFQCALSTKALPALS